jgi:hypothetical protein
MTLGIAMNGYEEQIEELIIRRLRPNFSDITYLEIGVASGGTLTGLAEVLKSNCKRWRAVGVELPDGYSYNYDDVRRNCLSKHLNYAFIYHVQEPVEPEWNTVSVYLMDSALFMSVFWRQPIHLALIDGCHCEKCCRKDFANVEEFIEPGGIVMFHDFGENQVGQPQPRGHSHLAVRTVCQELGLMDGKREGWEFVGELLGDKSRDAANMGVFKKS